MHGKKLRAALALSALALATNALATGAESVPEFITERGAKVVKTEAAPGGMTAFTVEKDGRHAVFFTSPDKAVTFLGVMFDSKTGANLSDKLLPPDQQPVKKVAEPSPAVQRQDPLPQSAYAKRDAISGHMQALEAGEKKGQSLADHMVSDKVFGVVEGKSSKDTVFVFIDPRCPYCHALYHNTRYSAKAGKSIKWIPVNTLGDEGVPKSAQLLKDGVKSLDAMANDKLAGITPSADDRRRIDENTAFMYVLAQKMGVPMATPTILFRSEKTGKLVIAQDDGSNAAILKAAFGAK